MNGTKVNKIVMPRTKEDVFEALEYCVTKGLNLSCRGTKHSMGGQSIAKEGVILDMAYISHVQYDAKSDTVLCGAGAIWSDVISHLNTFGKTPRTLQSYCTFSVGGSISVNAHGITSDFTMGECVKEVTLLRLNEKGERETLSLKAGDDLLKHVIGGYGLVGVLFEARLSVSNNVKVWMETLFIKPSDFPSVYAGVLKTGCVMKLARIDISTFDWIALYIFRSDAKCNTVSDLPVKAREMGKKLIIFTL